MDIIKSGNFICEQRKKIGLTQKELADRLGVTDKAVSKWENGRGFPDVSLLSPLSEVLQVTVTEILNGEAVNDNSLNASDNLLLEAYREKKIIMNIFSAILTILGIFIILSPLFTAATGPGIVFSLLIGAAVIATAVLISTDKFISLFSRLKLSRLNIPVSLAALIGAIITEALPFSYIMTFAAPPGEEPYHSYNSYFSLLPVGYGDCFPMLTAILSGVSAVLVAVLLVNLIIRSKSKVKTVKKGKAAIICTSLALFFSILTALLVNKTTSWSILIMLMLILSLILQFAQYHSGKHYLR